MSKNTQQDFIQLATQYGALKFGEFTLKSGRISPYFFNAGLLNSGQALAELGACYADVIATAIQAEGLEFDVLFGPAYKGIPLAAITAAALWNDHNIDVPYAFNRKEAKDHGEGGTIVGSPLKGNVLVIDDVITAGTAIREAADIITAQGAKIGGVVIAVDRQERAPDTHSEDGLAEFSSVQSVEKEFSIPVFSILSLASLISTLSQDSDKSEQLAAIQAYQKQYGSQ